MGRVMNILVDHLRRHPLALSFHETMAIASAPPILDFSAYYGDDEIAKAKLVDEVRKCCLYNGFFQIKGHSVPLELQRRVMKCAKCFFDLPVEEKLQIDKSITIQLWLTIINC